MVFSKSNDKLLGYFIVVWGFSSETETVKYLFIYLFIIRNQVHTTGEAVRSPDCHLQAGDPGELVWFSLSSEACVPGAWGAGKDWGPSSISRAGRAKFCLPLPFCSIQALRWLDNAWPHWGKARCFPESVDSNFIWKHPLRHTQK